MDIRQILRVFTFGFACFLPNLISFWVLAILPQIVIYNMGVHDKEQVSANCGYFFSSFYSGIIAGALIWPTIMLYISKRNAVFIGLCGLGFFNYLVGESKNLEHVYLFRFLSGMFHNLNSVGKDFVYQFAKPIFRLYSFSIKTLFTFMASFIGPFFGYYLYVWCNNDFEKSNRYITYIFLVGIALFYVVFFLDFKPGDIADDPNLDEEEKTKLMDEKNENFKEQKGLIHVFKVCMKSDYLRNLSIVYFLTNGVYKTSTMLAIMYIETPWKEYGYGINSSAVSLVALIAFIPAAIMVLVSPTFVPSKISYKGFIQFFITTLAIAIFLFPFARDLIPEQNHEEYAITSLVLLAFLFASVPKLYSPFINYNLNNNVDKYCRTSLNSLTFILSSLSSAIFATVVFPILGWSLYNPRFEGKVQYSKYISFLILDLGMALSLYILKKIN